jgi:hypothetical protein
MEDYDMEILYHPGKTNVVADTLSHKSQANLATLLTQQHRLLKDMRCLDLMVGPSDELRDRVAPIKINVVAVFDVIPTLIEEIRVASATVRSYVNINIW